MLIDYINRNPEFILSDIYSDEDLSGAGTYRPEFERLLKDAENGKINVVLCKSQSRFSRDMEIVEKYINNKFKEWNVRFISLSDNADTFNSGNKKSRQINGLVNEWYLEDVSSNIRSAFNSKMKQGEFISPFASFGYEISNVDNNKLVIDPIASSIVKEIYTLYLKGLGFTKIAEYLNNNNIPSPSLYKYQKGSKLNVISSRPREEIKWGANAIKRILTNELYLGHLIQGKRTTVSYKNKKIINRPKSEWIKKENTHEAIIDVETFKKVQIAIKERTKPMKVVGIVHNLSGKVFCKCCNHSMRKKNSNIHSYLVCSNNRDGYKNCENKQGIRYDVLEDIILKSINEKIEKYYDERILREEESKKSISCYSNKLELLKREKIELEKNLSKNKKCLKNLYEDKVSGYITIEEFKELITCYRKDYENIRKQLMFICTQINWYQKKEENGINREKIFAKYKKLDRLNRVIIQEFIDKIYVGKINKKTCTRDIEIKWNLK